MHELAPTTAGRLPGPVPVLAGQLRCQLLLLLRNPNALMAGAVLPVLLLVLASSQHGHLAAATLAGRVVLGVTLIAYLTHAAGLVAAREAGVLKRWRATPLPGWLTTLLDDLPGRPTVDAVTRALHATGGTVSLPGPDLAVLAAWAAGGLLASVWLFRWEPKASR